MLGDTYYYPFIAGHIVFLKALWTYLLENRFFFLAKKKKKQPNESFSRASPLVLLFISILKYIKYYRSLTESMLEDQQIDLIPWAF